MHCPGNYRLGYEINKQERNEKEEDKLIEILKTEISKAYNFRLHQDALRFGMPAAWVGILIASLALLDCDKLSAYIYGWVFLIIAVLGMLIMFASIIEHCYYIRYRGWQYFLEWLLTRCLLKDMPDIWREDMLIMECVSLKGVENSLKRLSEKTLLTKEHKKSLNNYLDMIKIKNIYHSTMFIILLIITILIVITTWMSFNKFVLAIDYTVLAVLAEITITLLSIEKIKTHLRH